MYVCLCTVHIPGDAHRGQKKKVPDLLGWELQVVSHRVCVGN